VRLVRLVLQVLTEQAASLPVMRPEHVNALPVIERDLQFLPKTRDQPDHHNESTYRTVSGVPANGESGQATINVASTSEFERPHIDSCPAPFNGRSHPFGKRTRRSQ